MCGDGSGTGGAYVCGVRHFEAAWRGRPRHFKKGGVSFARRASPAKHRACHSCRCWRERGTLCVCVCVRVCVSRRALASSFFGDEDSRRGSSPPGRQAQGADADHGQAMGHLRGPRDHGARGPPIICDRSPFISKSRRASRGSGSRSREARTSTSRETNRGSSSQAPSGGSSTRVLDRRSCACAVCAGREPA